MAFSGNSLPAMEESCKSAYFVDGGITRVSEMMVAYNWLVENASFILRTDEFEISSPVFSFDESTRWQLTMSTECVYPSQHQISISLFKVSEDGKSHSVKYDVHLADGLTNQVFISQSHSNVFKSSLEKKPCIVLPMLSLRQFMKNLPHDTLLIQCCMTITVGEAPGVFSSRARSLQSLQSSPGDNYGNDLSRMKTEVSRCDSPTLNANVEEQEIKSLNISTDNLNDNENYGVTKQLEVMESISDDLQSLSADFESLFVNKTSCDIVLRAGDVEVKAHRAILSARSPYLSTLLETNNDFIELHGMSGEVLNAFLHYLYCGKTPHLTNNLAIKLVKTAIVYKIPSLEKSCISYIKSSLSPQNICDVLRLTAEVVTLRDLKMAAFKYIQNNDSEIMTSKAWSSFAMENPRMGADVLLTLDAIKRVEKKDVK